MKIKLLEYQRYKFGIVKVKSHKKVKGVWKENPKYKFHKKLLESQDISTVLFKKESVIEVK